MNGNRIFGASIADGQVYIPVKMEICHRKNCQLSDESLVKMRQVLQEVILSSYARKEYRICERMYIEDVGEVLATNNGDPTTYTLVIEDEFDDCVGLELGKDPFDLIDELEIRTKRTTVAIGSPVVAGQVA